MSAPIFVLGCHRSGTSAVSGLLHKACGVSMGELMPATEDNPLGYFESQGIVDAHRGLLRQMERDWTCPPSQFDPEPLDLSALQEQVAIHRELPSPWAMKDPRSMFLFPAWSALGLHEVRLVGVVRSPADTIKSIVKRDGIREDRAEAIVDTYLARMVDIAEQVPLPVIQFPGDDESVTAQVRALADSLDLPWDDDAAQEFFRDELVRNRTALTDTSPTYDRLLEVSSWPTPVPTTDLRGLVLDAEPAWHLETHLSVHHAVQRNQLWSLASFDAFANPEIVELLLDGARTGGRRPRRLDIHQLVIPSTQAAGAALLDSGLRPHGVVANGLLADLGPSEVEFFLRSVHLGTHALAELVVDVPNPEGDGLLHSRPAPPDRPTPAQVQEIAESCAWDLIESRQLSPARVGMVLRKRVPTDEELSPVVTELIARAHRITAIDARIEAIEAVLGNKIHTAGRNAGSGSRTPVSGSAESRAAAAERDLERLRSRRSVRFALAMSRPLKPVFQALRSLRR